MDLSALIFGLSPQYVGELTVDNTPGGVGFDPAKLTYKSLPAELVRVTAEGGDFRATEIGVPTTTFGDLLGDRDEFFVPGEDAIRNWRAIRVGAVNAKLTYHVYF
jgi:hypothetical protein